MVGGLAEDFEDADVAAGVVGGPADHFAEVVHGDESGAGEGGEDAAGAEELGGEEVDVLVGAEAFFEAVAAGDEARGVEDDEVPGFAAVACEAQACGDVGGFVADGYAGGVEIVVAAGLGEGGF